MNTIKELYKACKGKRVLVRFDGNVPEDVITKGEQGVALLRIRRSIKTIQNLSEAGARVIIMTHMGDSGERSTEDLVSIFELYNVYPSFYGSFDEGLHEVVGNLEDGEVLLLQNVRTLSGEKTNDPEVAKLYASLADYFVQDGFSVSHRDHASVTGVAKLLPSCLGEGVRMEIEALKKFTEGGESLGVVMGGAKLGTKLPLVNHFIQKDELKFLMLGGALAHPYYAARGFEIGTSLTDKGIDLSNLVGDERVFAPEVVKTDKRSGVEMADVQADEMIIDADGESLQKVLMEKMDGIQKIFWNGQLGKDVSDATHMLASLVMKFDGQVVIGGGDTLPYLPDEVMEKKNIFVSTGGGALLDYLANGTLVGIEKLN